MQNTDVLLKKLDKLFSCFLKSKILGNRAFYMAFKIFLNSKERPDIDIILVKLL
jgi:hypothetical protein